MNRRQARTTGPRAEVCALAVQATGNTGSPPDGGDLKVEARSARHESARVSRQCNREQDGIPFEGIKRVHLLIEGAHP